MHAYNNYIDIKKKRIYDYDIVLIFDDDKNLEKDNLDKLEFIASLSKIFWQTISYEPNSYDLIQIIEKFKIRDLNTYRKYIDTNRNKYITNKYKNIADSCLISICFDNLDKDWLIRNSNIFSEIYIISYKKYELNLSNVHIIYSKSKKSKFMYDLALLSIDLKPYFDKIFFLNFSQNIALLNGSYLDFDVNLVNEYIKNISLLKYNYIYCKTLVSIDNKLYEIDEDNYFFCKYLYYNLCNSNFGHFNNNKKITSPLVLVNNISSSIYINESYLMINSLYSDDIFEISKPYLIEKYISECKNIKRSNDEILSFFKKTYKLNEFVLNKSNKMVIRKDNIFSPYDYQFYDNSIILYLGNEIATDLVMLTYVHNLCKDFKKKMFLKWKENIYDYTEILNNYFYLINDCVDDLESYKTKIRYYNNKNSTDELIISSNDKISIVDCNNLNIDNRYYEPIKKSLIAMPWSSNILKFLKYLNKDCKIDINKTVCINVDTKYFSIINKVIKHDNKHILFFEKDASNIKSFNYTQIPLKNNNIIHNVIKLILLSRSLCTIDDNITNINSNIYKILFDDRTYHINSLLNTNEYISVDLHSNKINKYFTNIVRNHIYNKNNIKNGTLLITTSIFNTNILDKLTDSSYIDEIYIIGVPTIKFNNYKVKYFNSPYNKSITINNLIRTSKYDKILITDFPINRLFFTFSELNGNNFFVNKARNLCYFDLKQFLQLNGFHENSNEFIYDFVNRLENYDYDKTLILDEFDDTDKKYIKLEKDIKTWGKDCKQTILKCVRTKDYFLLTNK